MTTHVYSQFIFIDFGTDSPERNETTFEESVIFTKCPFSLAKTFLPQTQMCLYEKRNACIYLYMEK